MSSKRRLNDIAIILEHEDTTQNDKVFDVLKKFQPYMKNLEITVDSCTMDYYLNLLNAASDVEKLFLDFLNVEASSHRPLVRVNEFRKLKSMKVEAFPGSQELFDAVPDDSLEELTKGADNISADSLQAFVNRQKRIKKLLLDPKVNINVDHLALEELRNELNENSGYQGGLRALLDKQPELRVLGIGMVNDATFAEICKRGRLEELDVWLDNVAVKESITGLNNLQNLTVLALGQEENEREFWPGSPFLSQLELPNLKELWLTIADDLDPQIFVDLNNNMPSLKELFIWNTKILDFLPEIIEIFQSLKSLEVATNATHIHSVASRQNESLEKLNVNVYGRTESCQPIYDAIDACPNLREIELYKIHKLEAALLDRIRRQTQLTSLTLTVDSEEVLGQTMADIIKHFQESPNFVSLSFADFPASKKPLVEDFFGGDVDKYVIVIEKYADGGTTLLLSKKSVV